MSEVGFSNSESYNKLCGLVDGDISRIQSLFDAPSITYSSYSGSQEIDKQAASFIPKISTLKIIKNVGVRLRGHRN